MKRTVPDLAAAQIPGQGLVIFDGDCGFCTASVNRLTRHTRRHPPQAPWQSLELSRFGLSETECQERMWFVSPSGRVRGGASAVAATLRRSSFPFNVAGAFMALPLVAQLAEAVYRKVAANRYRLPGASEACALPPRDPAA